MTPIIRHLPIRQTPRRSVHDEVSAWLDERERERHRQQIDRVVNVAIVVVAIALIYVTIQLFIH
jgi:hypothetical protein